MIASMKKFLYLFPISILLFSCGSEPVSNEPATKPSEPNQEATTSSGKKKKNYLTDHKTTGSYELTFGEHSYSGDSYNPDYSDITYFKDGDASFISVRARDAITENNLLLAFYLPEEKLSAVPSEFTTFLMDGGDSKEKANVQFVDYSIEDPLNQSFIMKSGTVTVNQLSDGNLDITLNGTMYSVRDHQNENPMPLTGSVKMTTTAMNR